MILRLGLLDFDLRDALAHVYCPFVCSWPTCLFNAEGFNFQTIFLSASVGKPVGREHQQT